MVMDHDIKKQVKAIPSISLRTVITYEGKGGFYSGHVAFSLRHLVFDKIDSMMNMVLVGEMIKN